MIIGRLVFRTTTVEAIVTRIARGYPGRGFDAVLVELYNEILVLLSSGQ